MSNSFGPTGQFPTTGSTRRQMLRRLVSVGLAAPMMAGFGARAETLSCLPADRHAVDPGIKPANKKIGVSVAYLKVPFYANFRAGLEDGAKQFGLTFDLKDGNSGDTATELANMQNFVAQGVDAILLTPSGEGILPGIKIANDAHIPVIEVNNKAGFGRSDVDVVTYVGADDVEFGRLQGDLLMQVSGTSKSRVAYVMGFPSSPAQVLRARGWDEFRANNPGVEEVARVSDDFDSAKCLAVVQDLLSRFPKGQLDAIVFQGPESPAAADFANRSDRGEIKIISGDYPADVRQLINDGVIAGTVDQNPYPQAYEAMQSAYLLLTGQAAAIKKPCYLPLSLITKTNARVVPPAWGC